jgi:hypothetical protein
LNQGVALQGAEHQVRLSGQRKLKRCGGTTHRALPELLNRGISYVDHQYA